MHGLDLNYDNDGSDPNKLSVAQSLELLTAHEDNDFTGYTLRSSVQAAYFEDGAFIQRTQNGLSSREAVDAPCYLTFDGDDVGVVPADLFRALYGDTSDVLASVPAEEAPSVSDPSGGNVPAATGDGSGSPDATAGYDATAGASTSTSNAGGSAGASS